MADIQPLVNTSELRFDKIRSVLANTTEPSRFNYDEELDELILMFVDTVDGTFVHYVDGDVALICTVDDLDVVGFQIEGFRASFLPRHHNVFRELFKATSEELRGANVDLRVRA